MSAELRALCVQLVKRLQWYIDEDDVKRGGVWEKENAYWIHGQEEATEAVARAKAFLSSSYPDASKWKLVLQEDDCAPDARESFSKEFPSVSGGRKLEEFKAEAELLEWDGGMTMSWLLDGIELSISADDPFYSVRSSHESN